MPGENKMATATAGNDDLEHLRVIVYPEGDGFIAQCLEKDIATQAGDIPTLLERLDLTIDAECAMSRDRDETPFSQIGAAPNYFHDLWEKRSVMLTRLHVPVGHLKMEVGLAQPLAA
jgi:hypothetical protein